MKYLGVWVFILKATLNMNLEPRRDIFRLKQWKDHSDYGMRDHWDMVDGVEGTFGLEAHRHAWHLPIEI